MKWIQLLSLVSTVLISCVNNSEKKATAQNDQKPTNPSAIHPNILFQKNCAMCHGYNKDMTAPAIVSYSIDSILKYYDGKSTKDSVWQQHRKIQLTRNEWERIALTSTARPHHSKIIKLPLTLHYQNAGDNRSSQLL